MSEPERLPATEDTKVEMNCALTRTILDYIADVHGANMLRTFVERSRFPESYLRDRNCWISFDAYNRLLSLLVEMTGNPNAPYDASKVGGKGLAMGPLRVIGTHPLAVQGIYRITALWQRSYSQVGHWHIVKMELGHASMKLTYKPGYQQTRNNCLSIQGFLATCPQWLGRPPARVEHPCCLADGASECLYDMYWEEPTGVPSSLKYCLAALVGATAVGYGMALPPVAMAVTGLVAALAGLCVGHSADQSHEITRLRVKNREEGESLYRSLRNIAEMNEQLQKRVEDRTSELEQANRSLESALADLKESREKELEAERQAAIGLLAAGMAHEMNSPLNAIRLSLQAVIEDLGDSGVCSDMLSNAARASNRCRRIVNELLTFSREPQCSTSARLEEIVSKAVDVFKGEQTGETFVTTELQAELPPVMLDRAQIQQVVIVLLSNASDSMQGKGHIRVSLRAVDGHMELSVSDDGPGISEELKRRIFEPLFSTKKGGRRLGLGLSIASRLVKHNGGTIDVDSRPGEGTTFVVRFPEQRIGQRGDVM